MRVKTVIENRIPERIRHSTKRLKLLLSFLLVIDILIHTMFPFIMGLYFGLTKNPLFLLPLIVIFFFKPELKYENGDIKIKIVRGFR